MTALLYFILPAAACGSLVVLDQWVKRWAVTVLAPEGTLPFISGFLRFAYVENEGAAFGILQGAQWFFIPLTIVMLCVFSVYYVRLPRTRRYWLIRVPLIFVLAGAAGNFIDRAKNGFVVDMFEFEFITFPVFNVADMCLVGGAVTMAVMTVFVLREHE